MENYKSNIKKVKKFYSDREDEALELIGELLEGQSKLLAPVGQVAGGDLRQSIDHLVFVDKEGKGIAIGTDKHYGIYVEKGTGEYAKDGDGRKTPWTYYDPLTGEYYTTSGMRPQPFLEPAAMKNISKIKSIVVKVMKELDNN